MLAKATTWLLVLAAVAGGALLGFGLYEGGDLGSAFTVQEAEAQKIYPPHQPLGRLPPVAALPVWTPGESLPPPIGGPFDLTDVNVVFAVVIPYVGGWIHDEVTPYFADPSVAFRYVTLILNAGYDATAPYHPTATGVYSSIENRDSSESADSLNMNTAAMHAVYQLGMAFDPSQESRWNQMMTSIGLDPADRNGLEIRCSTVNPTFDYGTPQENAAAIGNFAGKCVLEGRANDGFHDGGMSGYAPTGTYPIIPHTSTVTYTPTNTVNMLNDHSKWQPLTTLYKGVPYTQLFTTPQWSDTEPYIVDFNPRDPDMRTPNPTSSNYAGNMPGYEEQARIVLEAAANLTPREKMIAEYYDNKAREVLFFPPVEAMTVDRGLRNTMEFFQLDFLLHIAQFDAGILAWQEKARYDAVRPITAIQTVFANEQVTLFDGTTVDGSEWRPYLDTGDHPEYPSATACFCAAQAEAWKQHYNNGPGGTDNIPMIQTPNGAIPGYNGSLLAGSSVHERGMPTENIPISYTTWTDYVDDCGQSRVWGGLHFQDAVDASKAACDDVGAMAWAYFETLLDGTAGLRPPAMAQPADPALSSRVLVCR